MYYLAVFVVIACFEIVVRRERIAPVYSNIAQLSEIHSFLVSALTKESPVFCYLPLCVVTNFFPAVQIGCNLQSISFCPIICDGIPTIARWPQYT